MPAGRPTRYKKAYAKKAYEFCRDFPFTDKDLARLFDVSEQTINTWKEKYPEFLVSLKKGKDYRDAKVERSLYERAVGYSHPEEKIFNNQGEIVRAQTTKHYPPDPTAMIFWLKNRQPQKWRDKKDIDFEKGLKVEIVNFTEKED
mgnify:CR=1 FL=1